ncbi:MAG: hypothetical protein IM606_11455 [Cytophagales bacterium]|jgi:hypothetical protein|nr:hypothetical protein [Cytophagales bacterium]MCA6387243.1 hypothetical protein [Cytophagales bacterium]MCA6392635.1 hypothetical protein [Cytophagales bacterium]MCA6395795.1 hypothetical protein [Cytophagales bacterium]MCA6398735.1 hypothetical protein [Cytophagales bacterium]
MSPYKIFRVTIFLLILISQHAFSQAGKSARSTKYRMPKVSRSKAITICPIFETSKYPYQGIGFKVGDPVALTYKFYPSKNWAFAVDGGKASSGLYNKYYRGLFENVKNEAIADVVNKDPLIDTVGNAQAARYLTHTISGDWFLEAKFLYQWDAEKISKGLQLYVGAGWQWRNTSLTYEYLYENGRVESKNGRISENRFTYGPVVLLGFEYSYFTLPVSAFIEVEMFTDAFIDPGYQRFQGGVGLRYIF